VCVERGGREGEVLSRPAATELRELLLLAASLSLLADCVSGYIKREEGIGSAALWREEEKRTRSCCCCRSLEDIVAAALPPTLSSKEWGGEREGRTGWMCVWAVVYLRLSSGEGKKEEAVTPPLSLLWLGYIHGSTSSTIGHFSTTSRT
jgi:hypothetical protein